MLLQTAESMDPVNIESLPSGGSAAPDAPTRDDQTHQRLEQLYEISQLFASTPDAERAFHPAVEIVRRTLPLRSAMLVTTSADRARTLVWPPARAEASSGIGRSARVVAVPLVVPPRPSFGVLEVEGLEPLDDLDRIFLHALASQLAIAFDRDHARQRDVTRREHAEEGRTQAEERRAEAEITGATAERQRVDAVNTSQKFEALAGENARLYAEATHAVRVRDELLAIVSHDLRSPVWAILMTADGLDAGQDLTKGVDRIRRSARRVMRLIEDLLDFASIEAGRLAMRRQPLDPATVLQDALASFDSIARGKGLTLTTEVEPELPRAHCDGDRILQVLSNLVGNATRVTPAGGHITVRAAAHGRDVLFSVADDGPGISADHVSHLFERYWRGDEAAYKGSGLGLAIASGIVTAHGGRIWAESTLGRGATFHFTIPAADVTLLFAAPVPPEGAPPPRRVP